MEKVHPYHRLWNDIIDKYFENHPEAGLAWWQETPEQQPEGVRNELYEIFWELTHNYISEGE